MGFGGTEMKKIVCFVFIINLLLISGCTQQFPTGKVVYDTNTTNQEEEHDILIGKIYLDYDYVSHEEVGLDCDKLRSVGISKVSVRIRFIIPDEEYSTECYFKLGNQYLSRTIDKSAEYVEVPGYRGFTWLTQFYEQPQWGLWMRGKEIVKYPFDVGLNEKLELNLCCRRRNVPSANVICNQITLEPICEKRI